MTMEQPGWNFEQEPYPDGADETDVNLRAYFDRMPDEKMGLYNADWTDEDVQAWDGNFRSDGNLMLICTERDVDIAEYRRVLADCTAYRKRARGSV